MTRIRVTLLLALSALLAGCPFDSDDSAIPGPSAADDSAAVAEFSTAVIDLAANDTDSGGGLDLASIEIVSAPSHGSLVVNADGSASYTHDGTAAPGDSFVYTIRDGAGAVSNRATVLVTLIPFPTAVSGLKTMMSSGDDRSYYLDLPLDYDPHGPLKPLIIAYHGTSLSHEDWLNGRYPLREAVGNGAILIYPDALFSEAAGYTQWDNARDSALFEDLLATLPSSLRFDPDRIFITGHSSGAGLADVIGCNYGDRIRGIAPVVGTLTQFSCTGAVAVMDIVGSKDPLANITQSTHDFWVLYNGLEVGTTVPGSVPPCVDYSVGSLDYPVLLCLHNEGDGPTEDNPVSTAHDWPSFAGEAIWTFFSSLNRLQPRTEPPPGGGNENALGTADTTISFTLRYPESIPRPLSGTVVLFPAGTVLPATGQQPTAFLNLDLPLGTVGPGSEQSYQVPVKYIPFGGPLDFPGSYTASVFIYVEGGSFPQPALGVDHATYAPVELVDKATPVLIPGVLTLAPFQTATP